MEVIQSNQSKVVIEDLHFDVLNAQLKKNRYSSVVVLTDNNTRKYCLPILKKHISYTFDEIIEMKHGETHKTIESCVDIWDKLSQHPCDRKSLLINLGGGVVTDLGGFVASTYKRGIDFINIPTTLLSMVDASVGGKTGIDFGALKNQIGVFNSPKMVLVNNIFLNTLPKLELRSGFSEIIKHCLIADKKAWYKLLDILVIDTTLGKLIPHSIKIKHDIITEDMYENDIRKKLNFGHTIGHAIESYFLKSPDKKTLLHGEAIAVGIIIESYLSNIYLNFSLKNTKAIKNYILTHFEKINFTDKDITSVIGLLIHDKKNEYGDIRFVLLEEIGHPKIDCHIEQDAIIQAFNFYLRD